MVSWLFLLGLWQLCWCPSLNTSQCSAHAGVRVIVWLAWHKSDSCKWMQNCSCQDLEDHSPRWFCSCVHISHCVCSMTSSEQLFSAVKAEAAQNFIMMVTISSTNCCDHFHLNLREYISSSKAITALLWQRIKAVIWFFSNSLLALHGFIWNSKRTE